MMVDAAHMESVAFSVWRIGVLLVLLCLATVGCTRAEAGKDPPNRDIALNGFAERVLENTCDVYAENWQSLRYHYGERSAFTKKCRKQIQGKNLVEGLWVIRALMADGHADFEIIDNDGSAQIHPLVVQYEPGAERMVVASVFDRALETYLGKTVRAINGKRGMDVLVEKAQREPQSVLGSSLEIAARTLTYTLQEKPYPHFSEILSFA